MITKYLDKSAFECHSPCVQAFHLAMGGTGYPLCVGNSVTMCKEQTAITCICSHCSFLALPGGHILENVEGVVLEHVFFQFINPK